MLAEEIADGWDASNLQTLLQLLREDRRGWKSTFVVTEIYQQADDETLLRVMTEGAELREVG